MKGFYISAAHKSSGKTTLSIGLGAALVERGYAVQAFKKGPDYIDPMWLRLATGRGCYNLDFYTQSQEEIATLVSSRTADADITMVEGNKGLFDGLDIHGSNSNAAMAKYLGTPVVLVLDTVGTIRGLAPLVLGYQAFDPDINIAGVILNKVGGPRHESKLIQVMETYTDVPVLGAVGRVDEVRLLERHLGLVPSNEESEAKEKVQAIARCVAESVDLHKLVEISVPLAVAEAAVSAVSVDRKADLKLGIARDAAFGFYYQDDLEQLQALGAELVNIDMLQDERLPDDIDGLFIGGGFPESFGAELEANATMRRSIAAAVEAGLPVYAECGGLMYMSQELESADGCYEMVGVVPGRCVMKAKPVGRGYIRLQVTEGHPWGALSEEIRAHEFHYSDLEWQGEQSFDGILSVLRGHGIDGQQDGFHYQNLVAGYAHMRNTEVYPWAEKFIEFVRVCKRERVAEQVPLAAGLGD